MVDGISRSAELAALLFLPGLLVLLGIAVLVRQRWPRGARFQIALMVLLGVALSPAVTLGLYSGLGRLLGAVYPGVWTDGSLFHTAQVLAIAVFVQLLPIVFLLVAILVACRRWVCAGGTLRWTLLALALAGTLWLAPSMLLSANDRIGFAVAHRVRSCGLHDGARILREDLRSGRDVSLDGLSGWHGVSLLSPERCLTLQRPTPLPPPAAVTATAAPRGPDPGR